MSHIKPIGIVQTCTDVYRLTGIDTYVLICKIEVIYGWVMKFWFFDYLYIFPNLKNFFKKYYFHTRKQMWFFSLSKEENILLNHTNISNNNDELVIYLYTALYTKEPFNICFFKYIFPTCCEFFQSMSDSLGYKFQPCLSEFEPRFFYV